MKKEITRLICAAICCTPIIGFAQTGDKFTSTDNLYKEGKELFQEKNYAAALPALKAFVKQKPPAKPRDKSDIHSPTKVGYGGTDISEPIVPVCSIAQNFHTHK